MKRKLPDMPQYSNEEAKTMIGVLLQDLYEHPKHYVQRKIVIEDMFNILTGVETPDKQVLHDRKVFIDIDFNKEFGDLLCDTLYLFGHNSEEGLTPKVKDALEHYCMDHTRFI